MSMKIPEPTKAEAMALFRLGVVGDLLARELSPGELRDELVARAGERYRPPGATSSRQYHWKVPPRRAPPDSPLQPRQDSRIPQEP